MGGFISLKYSCKIQKYTCQLERNTVDRIEEILLYEERRWGAACGRICFGVSAGRATRTTRAEHNVKLQARHNIHSTYRVCTVCSIQSVWQSVGKRELGIM